MNSQHFEHLIKYIFIVINVYLNRLPPTQKFQIKVVRLADSYRSKEKLIYSSIKKTFARVPFAHYINFVINSEFVTKLKRRYRAQN